MGIAEKITKIEKLVKNSNLEEANQLLDDVLKDYPINPPYKISILKAQVSLQKRDIEECHKYAQFALKVAMDEGKRARMAEALKLISMAFFKDKNYLCALKYIIHASSYNDTNDNEISIFKSVVQNKYRKEVLKEEGEYLSDGVFEDMDNMISNLPFNVLQTATADYNGQKLREKDQTENLRQSTEKLEINEKRVEEQVAKKPVEVKKATRKEILTNDDIKNDWFDSGKSIELTLYVKKIKNETVVMDFNSTGLETSFEDNDGQKYSYKLSNLFSTISTSGSTYKVYGTKLEIILAKDNDIYWSKLQSDHLNQSEEISQIPKDDLPASLSYPSSAKNHKDWSKFEDVDENGEDEDDSDPNSFFQKLYSGADDDVKRAMMKSFMESNGTSLSTDWLDVGSREVKPYKDDDKKN